MTPADYLRRVTPWQSNKPRFNATLTALTAPTSDAYNMAESLFAKFDLDLAQGPQLDVVGEYVGRSRVIEVPPAGIFFTWGSSTLGWGAGVWKGPYSQANGQVVLDDDTYRRLIRAKILANNWDGSVPAAEAALRVFFNDPATTIFIQDDSSALTPGSSVPSASDMAYRVGVVGAAPSRLSLSVLAQNLIPLKPTAVYVKTLVTTVPNAPLFGFGMSTPLVGGWGSGAWGATPTKMLEQ